MDVDTSVQDLHRVLVVADWRTDAYAVVAACRGRARRGGTRFALVVPAWLHGLDWAGDPRASRPCATRQLEALVRLGESAGLAIELAQVGDPDPTSAVDDALHEFAAGEILLCRDRPRGSHLLDLPHRLHRMTGLPVESPAIRRRSTARERRTWRAVFEGGHCAIQVAAADRGDGAAARRCLEGPPAWRRVRADPIIGDLPVPLHVVAADVVTGEELRLGRLPAPHG